MPRVTVLMSVFNGAAYVRESVQSILDQTYRDFQLIIVDDGSTDDTAGILASYRDPRITLVSQDNRGLTASLNRGLGLATGEYIARQDHDDVSSVERLAAQVGFLDANPRVGLLGTWVRVIGADGSPDSMPRQSSHPAILRWALLFGNPFIHSSVMIRRRALDDVGPYATDPSLRPSEDYELWSRIARRWEIASLPRRLVGYRRVPGSMSRDPGIPLHERSARISLENLRRVAMGRFDTPRLIRMFEFVVGSRPFTSLREICPVLRDLLVLERAFCAHYRLSPRAALLLRLFNRRRAVRRLMSSARASGR